MSEVTEERVDALRNTIAQVLCDRRGDGITTDSIITDEIARQWKRHSNGRDCQLYLGPSDRMPFDTQMLKDYTTRFVTTDGDPVMDLEIRESEIGQQIFVRSLGPQAAIEAVPYATFEGCYKLPERIFAETDEFRWNYETTAVSNSYSLYTEVCEGLKPASIFEIGVRYGYSAWAMLRACAAGTIYHGVDLRSIEAASFMLHNEYPQHELRLARCDSGTLTSLTRTYDLAHVDGNHSHEGALHDMRLCYGRAKYILVDDIAAFCTVNSAVNQFLTEHPSLPVVRYNTQTGHLLLGPLSYLQ